MTSEERAIWFMSPGDATGEINGESTGETPGGLIGEGERDPDARKSNPDDPNSNSDNQSGTGKQKGFKDVGLRVHVAPWQEVRVSHLCWEE